MNLVKRQISLWFHNPLTRYIQNPEGTAWQESHNPHSIYECPKCGYMELSSRDCEDEDI